MSVIELQINGTQSSVKVTDTCLCIEQNEVATEIPFEDVIGFDKAPTEHDGSTSTKMFYIQSKGKDNELDKIASDISGANVDVTCLYSSVVDRLQKVEGRPKRVVVFINPITGYANSQSIFESDVEPIFKLAGIKYDVIISEKPDHAKELAASFDFSPFDALVILGGDGTINELVNGLIKRKQKAFNLDTDDPEIVLKPVDIPVAVIPTGTSNGLALIAYGCVDVVTSTLHIIKGRTKPFAVYGNYCENKLVAYSLIMTGYGMFGDLIHLVDSKRWMRKFRYVFVPLWFFLFKSIREIDMDITLECLPLKNEAETDQPNTITERKSMRLTCALAVPEYGFLVDEANRGRDVNDMDFSILLYSPTSTLSMLKHFFNLVRPASREQVENCGFLSLKYVKSVKLEVANSDSDLNLMVNLDGEIYKLTRPEIYMKRLQNAYRIFTSLDRNKGVSSSNIGTTKSVDATNISSEDGTS